MEEQLKGRQLKGRQGIWYKNGASEVEIESFKIEEPNWILSESGAYLLDNKKKSTTDAS